MNQFRTHTKPLSMAMLVLSFVVCFASGCTRNTSFRSWVNQGFRVGPQYTGVNAELEPQWIDMQSDPRLAEETVDLSNWWQVLGDPILDELMLAAYEENLPIRQAAYRIRQAEAVRAITVGNLFPQAQRAVGDYQRIQTSQNVALPLPITNFSQFNTGFQAGWELDFWGRFRRSVDVADANLDASIADYDNVAVLLLANVASTYVEIRTIQERLEIIRTIIELQRGGLELAQTLFAAGQTNELDVIQARNNVAITEAAIPQLEAALRNANNRLCILLGMPPQDLVAELPPAPIPAVSRQVQVGIPADLLRRRPDLRRAERLVRAQSERIGIAEAALYPSISLLGSIEWQSRRLDDLFDADSVFALISPGFSWNILNYGRLVNGIELEQQRFREVVLGYQQAVLVAQQEVEDAMIRFLKTQEQADQLAIGVAEVNAAEQIAMTLYQTGAIDFNRVFLIQALQFAQQDELVNSRANVVLNLIAVYRSLGGGWEIRCPNGGVGMPLEFVSTGQPSRPIGAIPERRPTPGRGGQLPVETPTIPVESIESLPPVDSANEQLKQLLERLQRDQRPTEDRDLNRQLEELLRRRDQSESGRPPEGGR